MSPNANSARVSAESLTAAGDRPWQGRTGQLKPSSWGVSDTQNKQTWSCRLAKMDLGRESMDLEAAEEEEKVKLLILDEPESNVNKIPSKIWVLLLLCFA